MSKPAIVLFTSQRYLDPAPFDVEGTISRYDRIFARDSIRSIVNVHRCAAANSDDVEAELPEHKPFLVQFDCHGNPLELVVRNGVLVADPLGELCAMSGVRCMLLMSCESDEFAKRLAEYVDVVIGTTQSIYDEEVLRFAEEFYRQFLEGKSVHYAFRKARAGNNLFSMWTKAGTDATTLKLPSM